MVLDSGRNDKLILKYTKYLILFLSEDYKIIECSKSSSTLLNADPMEIHDSVLWEIVHPNDKVRLEKLILGQLDNFQGSPCERIRFLKKTGEVVWLDMCASYIEEEEETTFMIGGMPIVDLSSREVEILESEAALADSESVGRLGSWWVNIETKKNHWSKGNYKIWDQDPTKAPPPVSWVLGQLHPEDGKKIEAAIDSVGKSGKPVSLMFRRVNCDPIRYYLTRVRPWHIEGKLQEVKGVNIEITDIIEAQNELERKNEELTLKNERLSKYAFMNSHQIRGPLTNILGLLELVKHEEIKTDELIALLAKASEQLDDAIRKVNDLLTSEGLTK